MRAAAKVFARHGFDGVSLDQVAEEAGYTKGAVYSNFASKDDLFTALIEAHCQDSLEQTRRLLQSPGSADERLQRIGDRIAEQIVGDRDWTRLFMEFWTQSLRDAKLRRRFLTAWGATRAGFTQLIEQRARESGTSLALPADQLASVAMALTNGLALQLLLDPRLIRPATFGATLSLLVSGTAGPSEAHTPPRPSRGNGGRAAIHHRGT